MNMLLFVNIMSNTYPKKRKTTRVSHCSHAVLPVPLWYDAKATNERNSMRERVTR